MSPIVICTKRGDSGCHHVVVLTTRECRQLFAVESFQLDQHQRSNVNVLNGSDIVALLAGAGACSPTSLHEIASPSLSTLAVFGPNEEAAFG